MLVSRGLNFYFLLIVSLGVVLVNRFYIGKPEAYGRIKDMRRKACKPDETPGRMYMVKIRRMW